MPLILINGQNIDFPNTGSSPIWSEAVIQFAQAVESALSGLTGTGDIPKQFYDLGPAQNPASNVIVPGLSFSSTIVRAGFVRYSAYRQTTVGTPTSVSEAGNLIVVYDGSRAPGTKWEINRDSVGDASLTFSISDDGQFSFSTAAIPGTDHSGRLVFVGQATLQQ